ncbi:RNA methyltransferase, TrmH family [Zhouia amylolytica]|uniref:RNA methyltransferase, TrmH family n=1 Tax=Zhouia amylolytica TaxID=376730 RepID=A0A1I6RQE7_9FLAO|nr:RNA methyltransferase [Zhouia amylolytica]MCQ0110474.1 RNA methyltransferase [Zhouia amylolytica]SFS66678.1 RNA methyltransferase, TrmH family [Zhouia amylolytica]
MVTKNEIKLVKSLQQKKYRTLNGLFVVEGIKGIDEFLNSDYKLERLYVTDDSLFENVDDEKTPIKEADLKRMSSLKNPNKALALFQMNKVVEEIGEEGLVLALDEIRDPGNLGTIIRLCDWFGIEHLVCSEETVDCFNSKVVQATMGSLTRVNIVYTDLLDFIKKTNLPVFAADMHGSNVYKTELPDTGILVMGNEANGISEAIMDSVQFKVAIPQFGAFQKTESLNVATATAILLSEFRRTL